MDIGSRVMHQRHGVCTVVDRRTREVGDQRIEYLVLDVQQPEDAVAGDLTLMVSVEEAESQLRPACDPAVARAALAALSDGEDSPIASADNWRAVAARGDSLLGSDDLVGQARLVRDLERDDAESGLSGTLKRLRDRALRQVAGEIGLALGWDRDRAVEEIAAGIHGDATSHAA